MFQKFYAKLLRTNLVVSLGLLSSLLSLPVLAGQLSDGRSFFNRAPRLIRAASSTNQSHVPASYQFTVTVPQDAGEPLGALKFTQTENVNTVVFDQKRTVAFAGDSFAGGPSIAIATGGASQSVSQSITPDTKNLANNANASSVEASTSQSTNSNETTVVFDPPLPPGTTVTVDLRAERNPISGVYLFGVTAYPAGNQGVGQFLGYGRLYFPTNSRF